MTCEGTAGNGDTLPITPSYLSNPPIDYKVQVNPSMKNPFGKAQTNGIESADTCSASQIGKGVPVSPSQSPVCSSVQDTSSRQSKGKCKIFAHEHNQNYIAPICIRICCALSEDSLLK